MRATEKGAHMARCYVELRKSAARGTDSIAADVMRHLHARQHLGKAVVITDAKIPILSACRKQWLKLSRMIQKQRSSTLNADKILKYTHMITHMQHMHFTSKTPMEQPAADVYFLHPSQVAIMPIHCWTVYVLADVPEAAAADMLRLLPSEALIVEYERSGLWESMGLRPKYLLESQASDAWTRALHFLNQYHIEISEVAREDIQDINIMDDALDTLLGVSHKFLQVANDFQHALELARPLRLGMELRRHYDAFILLAHRVQALSPGAYSQQFLEVYNEDDTFFLYDAAHGQVIIRHGVLAQEYARHTRAGRKHLAHALRRIAERNDTLPKW
jgi:hypothetical protein